MKFAISGAVNIPFAVIIAGAVAAACAAYFKIVPKKNKKEFRRAVNKFLNDLENDILNWFVDVENFLRVGSGLYINRLIEGRYGWHE